MGSAKGSRFSTRTRLVAAGGAAIVVCWGVGAATSDQWMPPSGEAAGLSCGTFEFPNCTADDTQFDPKFVAKTNDLDKAHGDFGGGDCRVTRTPVVFVHGNADRSVGWDSDITGSAPTATPDASVYDTFVNAGYNGCELYGITYLSPTEQRSPQSNYHRPAQFERVLTFIDEVKEFTGSDQVDIVTHSLGVSTTLAALTWHDETQPEAPSAWSGVRRFVNIAGGLHGLGSCRLVGPANPMVSTCGSENLVDPYTFGFQPDGPGLAANSWTSADAPHSLRSMPAKHLQTRFYTIHAGAHDQVHCGLGSRSGECAEGALFTAAPNVRAQLDVGTGSTPTDADFDFSDGSAYATGGGDIDGVGHFKARNNSGAILVQMLTGDCTGEACAVQYAGPVTAKP